jgi:PHS family inorganic phosphate transporter-like MFS transporter
MEFYKARTTTWSKASWNVGTAGAWFVFDVLFYGNTLFQPIVMETASGGGGGEDALRKVATDSLILHLDSYKWKDSLLYAIIGSYWFPSLVYSPECRSTLNGISAAVGKAGARFGATLFEPAARDFGDDKVMLTRAGVCVLGFAIMHFFVRLPSVSG